MGMVAEGHRGSFQSLKAAASTGPGVGVQLSKPVVSFGLQVTHTGSPAQVVVTLEGSLNGEDWFKLAEWDSTVPLSSGAIVWVESKAVTDIRANLTTLAGGTSPTVSVWITGV